MYALFYFIKHYRTLFFTVKIMQTWNYYIFENRIICIICITIKRNNEIIFFSNIELSLLRIKRMILPRIIKECDKICSRCNQALNSHLSIWLLPYPSILCAQLKYVDNPNVWRVSMVYKHLKTPHFSLYEVKSSSTREKG